MFADNVCGMFTYTFEECLKQTLSQTFANGCTTFIMSIYMI